MPDARLHVDMLQNGMSAGIFETNVAVFDPLLHAGQRHRAFFVTDGGAPLQLVKNPLHCHKRHLHVVVVVADRLDRIVQHDQRGNERNKVARGNFVMHDQITSGPDNRGNAQGNDKMHQRRHHPRPLNHFDSQLENGPQRLAETAALIFVKVIGSNDPVAVISFVIMTHDRRARKHGLVHYRLYPPANRRQRIKRAEQNRYRNQRQLPGIVKQNENQRNRRKYPRRKQLQVGKQAVAGRVHVVVVPEHNLSGSNTVKKTRLAIHQPVKQIHFHVVGNFPSHPGVEIGRRIVEQALQTAENNNQNRNIIGSLRALFHHHHIHIRF